MNYPEWHQQAACLHHPTPDIFFPLAGQRLHQAAALALCNTCPVRPDCHTWADHHQPTHGIWGGETQGDRHTRHGTYSTRSDHWVIAALQASCGTRTAYDRHIRNGEEPCVACRKANSADSTRRAAARLTSTQHDVTYTQEGIT